MDAGSLIGRAREVADLRRVLAAAVRGGAVVLVSGEAGAGKTALAAAVAGHARDAGVRVAWGACREGDGGAPYAPWLMVWHALGRPASGLGGLSPGGGPAGRFRLFADVTAIVRDPAAPGELLIDGMAGAPELDDLRAQGLEMSSALVSKQSAFCFR